MTADPYRATRQMERFLGYGLFSMCDDFSPEPLERRYRPPRVQNEINLEDCELIAEQTVDRKTGEVKTTHPERNPPIARLVIDLETERSWIEKIPSKLKDRTEE